MIDRKMRIDSLRKKVINAKIDGFIVPLSDKYQNECPDKSALRLEWLTGFSGSAGVACVLLTKAVVLSDNRYSIQIKKQVDGDVYDIADVSETPIENGL